MKKARFLFSVFACMCITTYSQTIQYSRQTFQTPYADAMQMVANVGGYHHLLCFSANKVPSIYIFDAQLQLQGKVELSFKLEEASDIRIVPFKEHYYLYVHSTGTTVHELWKINGDGTTALLSVPFQKLVDSVLNKNTATLQLINQQEGLFVAAHTYFDAMKKMGSTVVTLDKELNPSLIRKVFYSFDKDYETLQQSMLAGNNLLLLKTSKNEGKGNSLDVVKVDLITGGSISNSFNSGLYLYLNPSFKFSPKDSGILVYATLREPANSSRTQRSVFINRLNFSLQEQAPLSLLRSLFRNNLAANYLLVQGPSSCWLNMANNIRVSVRNSIAAPTRDFVTDDAGVVRLSRTSLPSFITPEYNQPTAIRFTVLNENFKPVKDSLIANNKNVFDVQPRPYAQFVMNNKAYLILIQNFSSKHRGLLMVNATADGQLTTSDLRVFDRYNYLLPQLQAVGNYFILPYTYKNDIGLVKIKMEDQ
jgi:hypothetical protein